MNIIFFIKQPTKLSANRTTLTSHNRIWSALSATAPVTTRPRARCVPQSLRCAPLPSCVRCSPPWRPRRSPIPSWILTWRGCASSQGCSRSPRRWTMDSRVSLAAWTSSKSLRSSWTRRSPSLSRVSLAAWTSSKSLRSSRTRSTSRPALRVARKDTTLAHAPTSAWPARLRSHTASLVWPPSKLSPWRVWWTARPHTKTQKTPKNTKNTQKTPKNTKNTRVFFCYVKYTKKMMNGWMDEWMNGWMDEWMNGWMDEWI